MMNGLQDKHVDIIGLSGNTKTTPGPIHILLT